MSTDRIATLAKIDRALDMVSALCKGERRWLMSIPAEPDRDPDLIIADALHDARRLLRAEESEGERAIREMADRHAGRWSDQPDGYWLQRLMQEVGELASVLAGDHDDTVEHELAQIGSIARNWLRRRGDGIAPSAPPTADLNLVHQIAALDPETATRDEESQCFFCHAYWQGWQECRSTDPTSHAEDCLWVRARALAALRSTEPGGEHG